MNKVYIVFDDSGEDGETNLVAVKQSQGTAEQLCEDLVVDRIAESGVSSGKWKKNSGPKSCRWECGKSWIAWEMHEVTN